MTPHNRLTLPSEHEWFMRQYMAKYPYADAENIALSLSRACAMPIGQARLIARAWFTEWESKWKAGAR